MGGLGVFQHVTLNLPDQHAEDDDTFFKFVPDNGKVALHVTWSVPHPETAKPMLTPSQPLKTVDNANYLRLDPSGQSQWDIGFVAFRKRFHLTKNGELSFGAHALERGFAAEKYLLKQ